MFVAKAPPLQLPFLFSMRWFLADILGLFSANVGPFSRNVVPGAWIFSINVVPKPRMFSVPAIYVLDPLQLGHGRIEITNKYLG